MPPESNECYLLTERLRAPGTVQSASPAISAYSSQQFCKRDSVAIPIRSLQNQTQRVTHPRSHSWRGSGDMWTESVYMAPLLNHYTMLTPHKPQEEKMVTQIP